MIPDGAADRVRRLREQILQLPWQWTTWGRYERAEKAVRLDAVLDLLDALDLVRSAPVQPEDLR